VAVAATRRCLPASQRIRASDVAGSLRISDGLGSWPSAERVFSLL